MTTVGNCIRFFKDLINAWLMLERLTWQKIKNLCFKIDCETSAVMSSSRHSQDVYITKLTSKPFFFKSAKMQHLPYFLWQCRV